MMCTSSSSSYKPPFELESGVKVQVGPNHQADIPRKVTLREYTQGFDKIDETRTCTLFPKGECRKGAICPFWHGMSAEERLKSGIGRSIRKGECKNQKQQVQDLSNGGATYAIPAVKLNSNL